MDGSTIANSISWALLAILLSPSISSAEQSQRSAGRADEAQELFAQYRALHLDSWNIFRESTERMDTGIAAGEEFWGKVMALGDKAYCATIYMEGMT